MQVWGSASLARQLVAHDLVDEYLLMFEPILLGGGRVKPDQADTARHARRDRRASMGQAVVHFEVIGREPEKLRSFYGGLFDWEFDASAPVSDAVSEAGNYGFVDRYATSDGTGIRGGVGGGNDYVPHAIFYVAVPDVEAALQAAERLGGKRVLGPEKNPGNDLVVGHFTDPEGNLIGVAGA